MLTIEPDLQRRQPVQRGCLRTRECVLVGYSETDVDAQRHVDGKYAFPERHSDGSDLDRNCVFLSLLGRLANRYLEVEIGDLSPQAAAL